ncbi:ester cyclase [Chryseobacterium gregarium]|uniref:ester cyclase n=1 Tax=Chryseobacterium gregarium TaxID=456299 RepID=UPI0004892139|nr:ester cyclase [Chryseobacterium gregarium]
MGTTKEFFNQFLQFINTADEDLAQQLISPIAKFHVPFQADPLQGPKGYLTIILMMRSGFPDIKWCVEDMITENDKVAVRFTMRGTHNGTFFGVPATGKPIIVNAMNFYRLSDDQIIEEIGQPDMLSLLTQIGAVPAR